MYLRIARVALAALVAVLLAGSAAADDYKFLGKLGGNKYDAKSVANPYGRYGSKYSPNSINNPYGRYGSKYSPTSPNNPYATNPPVLIGK
jgi:hypothetical protein